MFPWVYVAQADDGGAWTGRYVEHDHRTPAEEAALPAAEREALMVQRNAIEGLPLVNFTTQYGFGCFEGLKAFPQPDGSLKLFRPADNARRMHRSMTGLLMPAIPEDHFLASVREVVKRNHALGFTSAYDPAWAAHDFLAANSVYVRPFSYSEGGIGLNVTRRPFFVVVTTPVGSYFDPDASSKAVTTTKSRATRGGTGWIKCASNYVIPILTKYEVQQQGFMEVIFLDAETHTHVEEGSSANIFFLMKSGELVTPTLEDTVLAGITRSSIMQLARDRGVTVVERRVPIEEVMSEAVEAFVTGTAAGISYLESITHNGAERVLNDRAVGELTHELLIELKGIQYGARPDRHGWLVDVLD